jgi:pilus assembly protein CpaC
MMTSSTSTLRSSLLRVAATGILLAAIMAAGTPTAAQNTVASASAPAAGGARIIKIAAAPNAAPQRISLPLNNAVIVDLDTDARDVFVANPQVVDAVVRTPRRIFLMSLKLGQTTAIFMDSQGRQIGTLDIDVGNDVTNLNSQLASNLPQAKVKAEALNDNVVLSGTVNTVQEASRAQDLARSYAGTEEKVVNNLNIDERQQVLIQVRVSEMSRNIAKQFGVNFATISNSTGVPIIVSTGNQFSLLGRALSDVSGAQVGQACQITQFQQRLIPDAGVPTVQPPPQIFPDEYRNALGIIPGTNIGGTNLGFSATNICRAQPNNVQSIMQALERVGLVHTLAEPNLTAISGESAKFLAGGEFPVPTSRDRDGNITVEFKPFGVGLSFTPVVLSKGRISLQISTEVSELTNTGALTLGGGTTTDSNGNTVTQAGLTLPALAVRRTATTVELPSGGSLAIGGLIQQQTKQSLDAFPGVKDLPVLGALFRSRDFQNNETELVVSVSAYLVNPVSAQQLAQPDDGFVPPTDAETMLLGRVNAVYGSGSKLAPDTPKSTIGYIVQ